MMMRIDSPSIIGIRESSEEFSDASDYKNSEGDFELDVKRPYIHENDRGEAMELDG